MKYLHIIILTILLSGCVTIPNGEWKKDYGDGYTCLRINADRSCLVVTAGENDGMGFECTIENDGENLYVLIPLEKYRDIDSPYSVKLNFQQNSDIVNLSFGGNKIELQRIELTCF
tara:strand:- start:43 stop:390 length:348 start_codon:yes stop_codon:yes gene_type:complete